MIIIRVNEERVEIDELTNITQLLQQINSTIDGIAIAINNDIVPKSKWAIQQFNNKDNVLIIKATQGG
ncbi:MAG: sulfur carrier protein [Flavobacteriales bacterium]|jgi:sulfur carrier protein